MHPLKEARTEILFGFAEEPFSRVEFSAVQFDMGSKYETLPDQP